MSKLLRMATALPAVLAATVVLATVPLSAQSAVVGRFVPLGMTGITTDWKAKHPSDQQLIYSLDSATGRIEICGDMSDACAPIVESERQAAGVATGRFIGLGIRSAGKDWQSRHSKDERLVYSMDSATGQIQICGDTSGACTSLSNSALIAAKEPAQIVIVYRRADSAALAGRIYDRLSAHYGKGSVFLDIYSIPLATDWFDRVKSASLKGRIVVALIGRRWVGKLANGSLRIKQEGDPVRLEIENALQAHVPIFPVLINGAEMPSETELPNSLKSFSAINAAIIDTGRNFDADMARLLRAIDRRLAEARVASP